LHALQRLDIALGAAQGLAFMHGHAESPAEDSSGGGSGDGGPPTSPTASPALHRDIKAANIGLTSAGGQLFSKLLDYGLCKPVKAGAVGVTHTVEAVAQGTPGYMAPELLRGQYTVPSEVYSLGCVLLELARGQVLAPDTAFRFKRLVRRTPDALAAGGAAAGAHGDADAAWPPAALAQLLALASECLEEDPEDRPPSMRQIIARLRSVRALVAAAEGGGAGEGAGAAPLACISCLYDFPACQGLLCKGGAHFTCIMCMQEYVGVATQAASLLENQGQVPCAARCASAPWALEELPDLRSGSGEALLNPPTIKLVLKGLRYLALDVPRLNRERAAAAERQRLEALAAGRVERVQLERLRVIDDIFTLRCPGCAQAFLDHTACEHLHCEAVAGVKEGCGAHFCGLCLHMFRDGSETLAHVSQHARAAGEAHREAGGDSFHFTGQEFEQAHIVRREGLLVARLRELVAGESAGAGAGAGAGGAADAGDGQRLARDVLEALAKDLADLHRSKDKIERLALGPQQLQATRETAPTAGGGAFCECVCVCGGGMMACQSSRCATHSLHSPPLPCLAHHHVRGVRRLHLSQSH